MSNRNKAVDDAVYWAVTGAVGSAVTGAVSWAVNRAVDRSVRDAVYWDVYLAVDRAMEEDSPHPALQDFFLELGEAS